jgi:purine-binding chemotaxis protein CheW
MHASVDSGISASSDATSPAALREAHRILVCRVGSHFCAVPIEQVVETLRPLPVAPLAGMPAFVSGLCILRGQVLPVVDAARLLGTETPLLWERFVTIRVGERSVALAVQGVVGLRSLSSSSLGELPPLLREARADFVAAVGRLDGELLLVLEGLHLLPEPVWTTLAAAAP